MASTSTDCPGSWRPVPDAQPGDPVVCEVCGRAVHATLPPMMEETADPWRGSTAAHVRPHWFPAGRLAGS
jgi:hypothetical protein